MKNEIPFPALVISYLGTITNFVTEAKSIIGALAALASLVASLYAIAISRRKLKRMEKEPNRLRKHAPAILIGPLLLMLSACSGGPLNAPFLSRLATFPARVLDKGAELVTSTTTNIVEEAIVTATETVSQDPFTLLLATNTTLHTNVTLVTNITAAARPALTKGIAVAKPLPLSYRRLTAKPPLPAWLLSQDSSPPPCAAAIPCSKPSLRAWRNPAAKKPKSRFAISPKSSASPKTFTPS